MSSDVSCSFVYFVEFVFYPLSYTFEIHNAILYTSINNNTNENNKMLMLCVKDAMMEDVYVVIGINNKLRDEKVLKALHIQS